MSDSTYHMNMKPVQEQADDRQQSILDAAKKANGMVPNMYRNMVNLPGLQETYDTGYHAFRRESGFEPAEQEVVFLTLSVINGCDYCTAAHSFIGDQMSHTPKPVLQAIRKGEALPEGKLSALHQFVKVMQETKGKPSPQQVQHFLDAGYQEKHMLSIILAQAVKTISNYSNHIFHTEVDAAFADYKVGQEI